MRKLMKSMVGMMAAAMLLAGAGSAFAIDLPDQPDRNQLAREGRFNELQILQQRQARRDFQSQQQQFRAQDRKAADQPMDLKVPRYQGGCQLPLNGNAYLRGNCR